MPLFRSWIQGLRKHFGQSVSRHKRWTQETLVWPLRVTRLEDRRVLNADAMPIQQLVVTAAAAAGNGQADTFHIEQLDNQIRVSLNDHEVVRAPLGDNTSLKIEGSTDDDIFIIDLKDGA